MKFCLGCLKDSDKRLCDSCLEDRSARSPDICEVCVGPLSPPVFKREDGSIICSMCGVDE